MKKNKGSSHLKNVIIIGICANNLFLSKNVSAKF